MQMPIFNSDKGVMTIAFFFFGKMELKIATYIKSGPGRINY